MEQGNAERKRERERVKARETEENMWTERQQRLTNTLQVQAKQEDHGD